MLFVGPLLFGSMHNLQLVDKSKCNDTANATVDYSVEFTDTILCAQYMQQ